MVPAVRFLDVTKRFGSVVACDGVTFDAHAGEIHAIVGENGAGKSTLMKLLSGFLRPDRGEIVINGKRLVPAPGDARAAGIGYCAQHFHHVPTLTGIENVLLGSPESRWFRPPDREGDRRVRTIMERYGLQTDLDRPVQDLSIGEQERIEILSLLHRDSRILVLDEPTAVLAPTEVQSLFTLLRELAAEGRTILFVTHKLPEVMEIADRVTVMRGGRVVDSMTREIARRDPIPPDRASPSIESPRKEGAPASGDSIAPDSASRPIDSDPHDRASRPIDSDPHDRASRSVDSTERDGGAPFDAERIVAAIAGSDPIVEVAWRPRAKGSVVLELRDLSAGEARSKIEEVSLRIHEGEIVGIGGVEGNGQTILVQSILGQREPVAGTIAYRGSPRSPAQLRALRQSMGVIPEDRREEGLMVRRNLQDNSILGLHQRPPFSRHGWLDRSEIEKHATRLVHDYGVQPPDIDRPAGTLSGGNQQRLLVGRELWRDPELLIAVHPTRGVDIAATRFIHAELLAARDRGKPILLVSADLTELLAVCDRIAILYRGRIQYEAHRSELEITRLHRALLGLGRAGERR